MEPLKCKHCGNEFIPRSKHQTKYCSKKCRNRYWAKQQYYNPRPRQNSGKYAKQCVVCGKEFHTDYAQTKYCSVECRNENYEKKKYLVKTRHKCSVCGVFNESVRACQVSLHAKGRYEFFCEEHIPKWNCKSCGTLMQGADFERFDMCAKCRTHAEADRLKILRAKNAVKINFENPDPRNVCIALACNPDSQILRSIIAEHPELEDLQDTALQVLHTIEANFELRHRSSRVKVGGAIYLAGIFTDQRYITQRAAAELTNTTATTLQKFRQLFFQKFRVQTGADGDLEIVPA